MDLTPKILLGNVMHNRLIPNINYFMYKVYYIVFPLSRIKSLPIPNNRFGRISFYDNDHGLKDGSSLEDWVRQILLDVGLKKTIDEIFLICMPRVLGYVFNPVSFWLCFDKKKNLLVVLAEVNNTFKEQHTYICAHRDFLPIKSNDILVGKKVFHVSPLLDIKGKYKFRFHIDDNHFSAIIDYYNEDEQKQLSTSLTGILSLMDSSICNKVFFSHPLLTLKVILSIHWQAFKLMIKGQKYIKKPIQNKIKISSMLDFKNNDS